MQDIIEREIIIKATKQRVYDAIAKPDQVVLWFPETLEGNYSVNEQPIFGFGENGKNQVYIVDAKPHSYFAYRWLPGAKNFLGDVLSVPNTLVEFHITELGDNSCKVTVKESGFKTLSADYMEQALEQNSKGWSFMLGRLSKYFETAK